MKFTKTKWTFLITSIFVLTVSGLAQRPAPTPAAKPAGAMKKAMPQMQAILDSLASLNPKPIETLTALEARQQPTVADAVKNLIQKRGMTPLPEPVGKTEDRQIDGADGKIAARIYTPAGNGPFPVIVYFHGGGWVIATIDTYDSSARALTNAAGAIVVSVEYRKGPENKFSAAHDDAFAAYKWTLANARSMGGDASRIAIAGESAGGNLAVATAIMARDKKVQMPVHILSVYPIANNDFDSPSYIENANAKPLNKAMMQWFFDKYAKSKSDYNDSRIAVVKADLKNLPATTIIAAEIDPLRSEGELLRDRLKAAGVSVDYKLYAGEAHEFFGTGAVNDQAKAAVAQAAGNLRAAFGNK